MIARVLEFLYTGDYHPVSPISDRLRQALSRTL
jgi:hypothetical protein